MALADLRELRGGEGIHRLERDEPAPQALQLAHGARALVVIVVITEIERCRIGERLIVGQPELGADLLLEQAQRTGRALLLDRELRSLATQLGETLARLGEPLLGLAA